VPDSYAKVYAYRVVKKGMAWRLSLSFSTEEFFSAVTQIEDGWRGEMDPLIIGSLPSISEVKTTFLQVLGK